MYSVIHKFIYNNVLIQPNGAEGVQPLRASITEAGHGRSNEATRLERVKVVICIINHRQYKLYTGAHIHVWVKYVYIICIY